jgi:hypothetical protein
MRLRDRLANTLGLAPSRPRGASPSRFEAELDRQTEERHARILTVAGAPLGIPENPPGFRAKDVLGTNLDGFLPISEADEKTIEQAKRGLLELRNVAGIVHVRPALVTVLHVHRDDGPAAA